MQRLRNITNMGYDVRMSISLTYINISLYTLLVTTV